MAWVWLAALAFSAGCADDTATPAQACTTLCECAFAFPSHRDACVADCRRDLAGVDAVCLDCIADLSCRQLDDEALCQQECAVFDAPTGTEEQR